MADEPKKTLLAQVQSLLEHSSVRGPYRPTERAPRDAEFLGTLSEHAKKLYIARESMRKQVGSALLVYENLDKDVKSRIGDHGNFGSGILAIVAAGADEVFREQVERLAKTEEELQRMRPLATVLEVLYEQEVRDQYPKLGNRKFSIDLRWTVFHRHQTAGNVILRAMTDAVGIDR